jgi:glycosyltransferase involved in cell wall biosynthesis
MLGNPLVSIGLPTYSRAGSLSRAIESVLDQDYRNIELVISDNASVDETEAICQDAARRDTRIKYLRQQTNIGATANFREVLNQSTGEFFMWLADDDWLEQSYVGSCVQFLLDHPDYSLVCGKTTYFRRGTFESNGSVANHSQESPADRLLAYYATVWDNGTFYGMMRRDQISEVKLRNTMGGDWLFTAALTFIGKVRTLEDVSLNRSLGGSTVSYQKVADTLGLSRFSGSNPRISIAAAALKDVLASPVYTRCGTVGRLVLGWKAFAILERRKGFYPPARGFLIANIKRVLPASVVAKIHKWRSEGQAKING